LGRTTTTRVYEAGVLVIAELPTVGLYTFIASCFIINNQPSSLSLHHSSPSLHLHSQIVAVSRQSTDP